MMKRNNIQIKRSRLVENDHKNNNNNNNNNDKIKTR